MPDGSRSTPERPAARRRIIGGGKIIAGYNQTGWFESGLVDEFSQHGTADIDWVARRCGAPRYIRAVREATALGAIG